MGGLLDKLLYDQPTNRRSVNNQPPPQSTSYDPPRQSSPDTSTSVPSISLRTSSSQNNFGTSINTRVYPNNYDRSDFGYNRSRIQSTESLSVRPNRLVEAIKPSGTIYERLQPLTNQDEVEKLRYLLKDMRKYMEFNRDVMYAVENNFLKGMYELKKAEYHCRNHYSPEEKWLIHSTDTSRVDNIIKNNFDWRKVTRSKYGIGTSFSNDADYANCHSNRRNGPRRAFIICKVLVQNSCRGQANYKIPPENIDTTVGQSFRKDLVYVKFNDNEFLPMYVVHYNSTNEMIQNSPYYEGNYRRRW